MRQMIHTSVTWALPASRKENKALAITNNKGRGSR